MGYIESNLLKGEEIVAKAKIHWAVFIPAIVFLIITLLIFSKGDYEIFVILFGVFILALLKGLIVFKTNELAITNQRIIGKKGLISRETVELKYEKIESISVMQSILGRILKFGTIVVRGTGVTAVSFQFIANPVVFKNKAMEKIG